MSAPVDVLAVLRSQLAWIGPCRPDGDEIDSERWDRIESAIAATADLIEAAEYGREWIVEAGDRKGLPNGGTLKLIDSAVARVKGGAA